MYATPYIDPDTNDAILSELEAPAWTDFVTMIGRTLKSLTTINYYPAISSSITDYKTAKECIQYAEEATNEVKQYYMICTFDLWVCMKAYPLILNNQAEYDKHIIPYRYIPPGLCIYKDDREKDEWIGPLRHLSGSRADVFMFSSMSALW